MGKSLRDKIQELPMERQKKIEARAQELIAQELQRQQATQKKYIIRKSGVFSTKEVAVLRKIEDKLLA